MARPREFDETTALEAAMNCFWAQGFEQTSVRDLAERMGITGASLYNAFGDKRALYRQVFVYYLAQTVRDRVARLEKLRPLAAIRTFFDEIIERSVDDEQRRGCMLVNAAVELAPYDPQFQHLVAEEMIYIEAGSGASGAARLAGRALRGHPSDDGVTVARRDRDRADVPARDDQPGWLLPSLAGLGAAARGDRLA